MSLYSAHLSSTFLSVLSQENESTGQAVIECDSVCSCLIVGELSRPPAALLTSPQAAPSANQSSSSLAIRPSGTAGKYGQGGMGGEKRGDIKCLEVCLEGMWRAEREDHLARWIITQQEAGGSIENQAGRFNQADDEAHQLTESEEANQGQSASSSPSHLILSQPIREGAQPSGEQLHAAG